MKGEVTNAHTYLDQHHCKSAMKKKTSDSSASKRRKATAALVSMAAFLLIAATLIFFRQGTGDPAVFTVNREPVSKREFVTVMSGQRANVFTYMAQKYGAEDNADFWTTSFGGEIPLEVLKQRTIEKLQKSRTSRF